MRAYLADPAREIDAPDRGENFFKDADETYGDLVAWLTRQAPVPEDLKEQGTLMKLSDDAGWVVEVHDARYDGFDLDASNARGLVKGDFVFAFFTRRLSRQELKKKRDLVEAAQKDDIPRTIRFWSVGKEAKKAFTGLVVFSKTYLETPSAK